MSEMLIILKIVPRASKIAIAISVIFSTLIMAVEGTSYGIVFNLAPELSFVYLFAIFLSFVILYPVVFILTYVILIIISRIRIS